MNDLKLAIKLLEAYELAYSRVNKPEPKKVTTTEDVIDLMVSQTKATKITEWLIEAPLETVVIHLANLFQGSLTVHQDSPHSNGLPN